MIFTNNFDPVIFTLGPVSVRWYGLFFAIGLLLFYLIVKWIFKKEKFEVQHLDSIAIYLFFGLLIGARLGHVLFYNAEYFFSNPLEILKVWKGGLASHGAAIGIFVAYLIWIKVHKVKFIKYADAFVIPMPLAAAFVRMGNFMNSEIMGVPTYSDYGVIFKRLEEDFARHPSQLYEGFVSLLIFFILFYFYKKHRKKLPKLFFLFLYMLLYFPARFIIEFTKERFILPTDFPLSMGQTLSIIPILLAASYFIFFYPRLKKRV